MLFFALFAAHAQAQVVDGNDSSPYTQVGIGDLASRGLSRNIGMANTGVSMGSRYYINTINPALLADNKLTIFEFGLQFRIRLLNSVDASQRNFGGNFSYLALALPLSKKFTIAAGFKPYTSIRYNTKSVSSMQGDTLQYETSNNGQGSIAQVFLSGGYEISPNWLIGASASFLFGKVAEESSLTSNIPVTTGYSYNFIRTVVLRNTVLNGYNVQGGIVYRRQIISEKMRLNIGASGSYAGIFNSTSNTYLQKRTISGSSENTILRDTLGGSSVNISLPSTFTFGASVNNGEEWSIGTDFTYQNFSGQTFRNSGSLQNAYTWSLGGEFNPIFEKKKSYFSRMVYRAGVYAGQTQYIVNGVPIADAGFTVGFGVPLGKLFSYINVGCQIGTRGTLSSGLVKEDYFKFDLGLNINDRWFIRPKVD